jgi:hypothetical protein
VYFVPIFDIFYRFFVGFYIERTKKKDHSSRARQNHPLPDQKRYSKALSRPPN